MIIFYCRFYFYKKRRICESIRYVFENRGKKSLGFFFIRAEENLVAPEEVTTEVSTEIILESAIE